MTYLAQLPTSNPLFYMFAAVVLAVVMLLSALMLLARYYKRCPSNRVLVIYGRTGKSGQAAKAIHGGAAFIIPLLQDYAYLSLEPIQIEVPLRGALSSENIRVNVPSVFTVAIDTKPEVMHNAAIRLLGLSTTEIRKQAEEMIFGQLRQVIASMGIEEINRDRDKFLEHVQHSLEPELAKIGLQLINVNITDITDESGYIDAIGQKAASLAIQLARGDVADNLKMGEIRVTAAERDRSIQVSIARKEQSIGTRSAEREQAISIANLEKEQAVAERQSQFEREASVKDAERQMRVSVAQADAIAIDGENQSAARIAASAAELAMKKAEAYEKGEGRKKQAEAMVMEMQNRALAKAALAEAERVEAEQRAKLEAPAKAEKAKMIVDAEAAADRRRLEAQAEADAIYLKLEAEARGQFQILAKKGEGLKAIVDACGGSKEAFQMLLLEHLDYLADASAKAISNIKFDKVVVWENGGHNGNGKSNTADFISGMAKTLPPMLQVMKDIGGIELPESFVRFTNSDNDIVSADGAAKPRGPSDSAKPIDKSSPAAKLPESNR